MRQESHYVLREDRQLIVLTHLSQLITLAIGFGSLLLPLILWVVNKDRVHLMDAHGKRIVNFQLSILIYSIICVPLVFIGIGILGFIALGIISVLFPIINAIKASNGEIPTYPLSIEFLK
ncbi:DUF4870 domain-containing protein [Pontimicrobium sp. IMCC45349]|jgi:uncharacterized Tic20 family protein|uniref:DUF4870 domain-containing protein n=1 Tax=Pontimicrobium sp. IMCC45349 TaxID=3391574 RepID=UPI0039A34908